MKLIFLTLIFSTIKISCYASEFLHVCRLHDIPTILLTKDANSGNYVLSSSNDKLPLSDSNDWNNGTISTTATTYEARECYCSPGHYCLLGDGDMCGLRTNSVECFHMSERMKFVRNIWPVIIPSYLVILAYLFGSKNGYTRNYILLLVCPRRGQRRTEEMVTRAIQREDRMRANEQQQMKREDEALVLRIKRFTSFWKEKKQVFDEAFGEDGNAVVKIDIMDDENVEAGVNNVNIDEMESEGTSNAVIKNAATIMRGKSSSLNQDETSCCYDLPKIQLNNTMDTDISSTFEDEDEEEVCTICMLALQDGDRIGALPCNHNFHAECLKHWIRRRNVCPLCLTPDVASPRRRNGPREEDHEP